VVLKSRSGSKVSVTPRTSILERDYNDFKITRIGIEKKGVAVTAKGMRYNDGMSTTVKKVVKDAMALPPALRAFVAEKLIESLDAPECPPLSPKWKKEVRRRCAEVDRVAVKLRDADVVFAKAHASLK
jgi:hypothetical protein